MNYLRKKERRSIIWALPFLYLERVAQEMKKNFKKMQENQYFEVVGLIGMYKADHSNRQVKAYRITSVGRIIYDGVVKGLYDNLEKGLWKIK